MRSVILGGMIILLLMAYGCSSGSQQAQPEPKEEVKTQPALPEVTIPPEEYVQAAERAQQQGEYPQAIRYYRLAGNHFQQAKYYYLAYKMSRVPDDLDKAEEILVNQALINNNEKTIVRIAEFYHDKGNRKKAAQYYRIAGEYFESKYYLDQAKALEGEPEVTAPQQTEVEPAATVEAKPEPQTSTQAGDTTLVESLSTEPAPVAQPEPQPEQTARAEAQDSGEDTLQPEVTGKALQPEGRVDADDEAILFQARAAKKRGNRAKAAELYRILAKRNNSVEYFLHAYLNSKSREDLNAADEVATSRNERIAIEKLRIQDFGYQELFEINVNRVPQKGRDTTGLNYDRDRVNMNFSVGVQSKSVLPYKLKIKVYADVRHMWKSRILGRASSGEQSEIYTKELELQAEPQQLTNVLTNLGEFYESAEYLSGEGLRSFQKILEGTRVEILEAKALR